MENCFFLFAQSHIGKEYCKKNEPFFNWWTLYSRCTEHDRGEEVLKEENLVAQLKEGSREAFDELYETYKDMAMRTEYLITGNMTDSEVVTQ